MLRRLPVQACLASLNNLQAWGSPCLILMSSLPCYSSHCLVEAVHPSVHKRVLMEIACSKYRYSCGCCCSVSRNGAFGNFPPKSSCVVQLDAFNTTCSFAGIAFLRSCFLHISASWRDVEVVTLAKWTDPVLTLILLSLLCCPVDSAAAQRFQTNAIKTSHLVAGGGIKPYKLLLSCSVQCRKLRGCGFHE